MIYLFIFTIIVILYHLFFYGAILQIIAKFKKQKITFSDNYYPSVTLVTAAYNEEKYIEEKILSFINLDYPKEKINLVIVSDDSDDDTNNIVKKYDDQYDNIKLIIQTPRKGKASALNLIEPSLECDIVISSDASSILDKNSIKQLVRYFTDDSIGLVTGRLTYLKKNNEETGEGLYWKYETWIRSNESKVYSIIVASGCLFAIRRELYKQIHPSSPDDFERTLITLESGYKAIIEPEAVVYEYLAEKTSDEINRKVRIISREWFALFRHASLLNPITNFNNSLFLFSHKIIRWLLPVWSFCILVSNIFLFNYNMHYKTFLFIQIGVIVLGLVEVILEKNKLSFKILKLPAYLLIMNYASAIAIIKALKGEQQTTWNTIRN